MATFTMTEFNRNPSRIARAADENDVYITDRGIVKYQLKRVEAISRRDQLIAEGLLVPAPRCGQVPRSSMTTKEQGAEAIANWERDRNKDDHFFY